MTFTPTDICLDPQLETIWQQALSILEKQISKPTMESFVRNADLTAIEIDTATVSVNNDMARGRLTEVIPQINQALTLVLGRPITAKVQVSSSKTARATAAPSIGSITVLPEENPSPLNTYRPRSASTPQPNPANVKHTFDSFVVGSSNRFCYSAALAVASQPGQDYNPLFIYGGVGLGKTHLLNAICNKMLSQAPHTVVRYMTCERFMNEMISAVQNKTMHEFKKRYRQVDVLLVDDIQFIEGKESTQEEFFHTFNSLKDAGKQVVLSSDRPPSALAKLEARLRSRFEGGLIADIQPPDFETRLAILRQRAEQEKMVVASDVLDYIAGTFTSNVRELEGALTRANAYAKLSGESLTTAALMDILQPGVRKVKPILTIENILDAVASYYRVEPSAIRSKDRSQDVAMPRHVVVYLAHELAGLSFPKIGQHIGKRSHQTCMYGHDKISELLTAGDADLTDAIRRIKQTLGV